MTNIPYPVSAGGSKERQGGPLSEGVLKREPLFGLRNISPEAVDWALGHQPFGDLRWSAKFKLPKDEQVGDGGIRTIVNMDHHYADGLVVGSITASHISVRSIFDPRDPAEGFAAESGIAFGQRIPDWFIFPDSRYSESRDYQQFVNHWLQGLR